MHIKSFHLKNFKKFTDLRSENLGQFNLIVGDNNIGKTTLLEALTINDNPLHSLSALSYGLFNRKIVYQIEDIEKILEKYTSNSSNKQYLSVAYEYNSTGTQAEIIMSATNLENLTEAELKEIQTQILINKGKKKLLKYSINNDVEYVFPNDVVDYIPIIPVNLGYANDLVDFYSKAVQKSSLLKQAFIKNLNLFAGNISDIEISTDIDSNGFLIARIKDVDTVIPITLFGEGTVKLSRILLEILMCKGERLMIDEIDTGIHHSRFKKFWKTILLSAAENSVQIFATTHSKECLSYFTEVLEEPDMADFKKSSRCIRLVNDNSTIKAVTYDFEQFKFALDQENEIR